MISIHIKNGFVYQIEKDWFFIIMDDKSKRFWTIYPVKFSENKLPTNNVETLKILSKYPYNRNTADYEGIIIGPNFGNFDLIEGYHITASLNIISAYITDSTGFIELPSVPIEETDNPISSDKDKNKNGR